MKTILTTLQGLNIIIEHIGDYYEICDNTKEGANLIGRIDAPKEGMDFLWELNIVISEYKQKENTLKDYYGK